MNRLLLIPFALILILFSWNCSTTPDDFVHSSDSQLAWDKPSYTQDDLYINALLLTRYKSPDQLKEDVHISYSIEPYSHKSERKINREVKLIHGVGDQSVECILKSGVDEGDFNKARDGYFIDRVKLAIKTPFAVLNKEELVRIELLGRRRYEMFGEGDIAFYDIAEHMADHIVVNRDSNMSEEDFSEKGYLNTFNHITAQAIMTIMYSDKLASFVADVHERHTMPELVSGEFTEEQLADVEKGPVDNYVDMVNNKWGQKLGNFLKTKYRVNQRTQWTPELLATILNEIQRHCGFALNIQLEPFHEFDELIIRFVLKLNKTQNGVSSYIQYYFARKKIDLNC